ncbi:MAG: TonB-dependent siderophore receptor [Moorea sp. SIO2I5]|nr:TonB-dependent siderophore receptor [Moorena sp. SIO2I5]
MAAVNYQKWGDCSLLLTIGLWLLISQEASAEHLQSRITHQILTNKANQVEEISVLDSPNSPAKTVKEWDETLQQVTQAELVEITDIRFEETSEGFVLELDTDGELVTPEIFVTGNEAIANIPNAVLRLPEDFSVSAPVRGIAEVTVTNLPDKQVRVIITSTDIPPTVNISQGVTGLTINTIVGEATSQDSEKIEVLVIQQIQDEDYFTPNSTTGTRTDTPVLEVPASILTIPRTVLEDQQVVDVDDALRNISGVSVNSFEGRGFQINLRGFEGAPLFRDGFRLYSPNDTGDAAAQGFPEVANIERIEVLRGPASIIFGQIEPGGAANIISKRPLDNPFYEVEFQAGNNGFVRPRIDLSGPLTEDNRLLYRLNAVYQNDDGFRDYDQDIDRLFISPALTWRISDRTDLNLQLEYLEDERPLDPGLVAIGDEVADLPRERILGEPDDFIKSEFLSVGYNLEHQFSDRWTLRNAFRYINDYDDIRAALSFPFIGGLNETTGILNRVFGEQEVTNETLSLQTNVVGKFATGSIEHTLLAGIDLARYRLESDSFTDFSLRIPINIFNPVYEAVPRPDRSENPNRTEDIDTDSLQIYVQDQIKLLENLTLVAGLNYETVSQETTTIRGNNTTTSELDEDEFIPRFGLVYQPLENLSLYGSYSRSFIPSASLTVDGDPLEPETGEGFEVGIKTELLNSNLLATLAYFNITKQNIATPDPNDPRSSVATGEQESQGIELDIVGEILQGWNLIASYSYIDAEISEDNRFEVGNGLPGVAEHSASLWTTYKIQSGDLAGLGFGIGFNWVGEREGDLDNSFELDSYFLTNAAILYELEDWRFALNFQNIFDVNYIEGTPRTRTRGIEPGEPFTIIGSIRVQF